MKNLTKSLLTFVAILFASVSMAQITSSSMNGRVTDELGPVMGATVVATHTPSGTNYGTTTNMEGRYTLPPTLMAQTRHRSMKSLPHSKASSSAAKSGQSVFRMRHLGV